MIAQDLGITVGAGVYGLKGPMTQVEYQLWQAHYALTAEEDALRAGHGNRDW